MDRCESIGQTGRAVEAAGQVEDGRRGHLGDVADHVGPDRTVYRLGIPGVHPNRPQLVDRVGQVHRQAHKHVGHLIGRRPVGHLAPHRHRHADHQRTLEGFAPVGQVGAQRLGARRQHHVVDRGTKGGLHELQIVQRTHGERHRTTGGDRTVEQRTGRIEWAGHRGAVRAAGDVEHHPPNRAKASAKGPDAAQRIDHSRCHGTCHQPHKVRHRILGLKRGRILHFELRLEVDQLHHQVGATRAVDQNVMDL